MMAETQEGLCLSPAQGSSHLSSPRDGAKMLQVGMKLELTFEG